MADRIVVMNDARIQQVADPLTIATRPATELVARFMGDNNIIRGRVTRARRRSADRGRRARRADERRRTRRLASSGRRGARRRQGRRRRGRPERLRAARPDSADCEILFVEFLGDLVKLHLSIGSDRMLAKVPGESYPAFPREGRRADPDQLEGGGCPAPPGLRPRPQLDQAELERPRRLEQGTAGSEHSGTRRPRVSPRLGHRRLGSAGRSLAQFLPDPAAGLHRPRQFLDLQARREVGLHNRLDVHELRHDPAQLDLLAQHAHEPLHVAHRRGVCLVLGFPVAYFLALKVHSLRNQIALFVIALAPFWTSFLVRSVAWTYPLERVLGSSASPPPSHDLGAPGDDPALHPVHDHAALLHTRAGRPDRDGGGTRSRRQLVADVPRGDSAADPARGRNRYPSSSSS